MRQPEVKSQIPVTERYFMKNGAGNGLIYARLNFDAVRLIFSGILLFALAPSAAFSQSAPSKAIDNGKLHAVVYVPDATNGFYQGTRFDHAGMLQQLTYAGHSFYDPWFDKFDPKVLDFAYQGESIVAGPATKVTGPVEEFITDSGGPLGFDEAPVGGTFVKIGVGVLRKPDDAKYDHDRVYELVEGAKWDVKATPTSVEFTQQVMDKTSGFGYVYRKTVRLVPGTSQMAIEHSLKNIGSKGIETRVYDHNFMVLDHQPTGPDFTIHFPFDIKITRPGDATLGAVNGGTISYLKQLGGQDRFGMGIGGFSDKAADYDITIKNSKVKAQVEITGDRPLESASLFSIRSVVAIEPYVRLSISQGQETTWKYVYTFGTIK